MTLQDRIYVLSNWASPNISAWSVYIPEFTINNADVVFSDPYVVLRATDGRIFRFGSQGAFVYDSCPVVVTTPFLSFDKPATFKFYQGFDAICSNDPGSTWNVQASFDPTVTPTPFDQICTIDGPDDHGRAHSDQWSRHPHPASGHAPSAGPGDVLQGVHALRDERHELMPDNTPAQSHSTVERMLRTPVARVDLLERELAEIKTFCASRDASRGPQTALSRSAIPTSSPRSSSPACAATSPRTSDALNEQDHRRRPGPASVHSRQSAPGRPRRDRSRPGRGLRHASGGASVLPAWLTTAAAWIFWRGDTGEPSAVLGAYAMTPVVAGCWAFGTACWPRVVRGVTRHARRVMVPDAAQGRVSPRRVPGARQTRRHPGLAHFAGLESRSRIVGIRHPTRRFYPLRVACR